jgi:2-oxoglutarate ferredoxin oxidoreductase subunit alpha
VRPSKNVGNRIFLEGNSAAALGCVYGRRHGGGLVPDHAVLVAWPRPSPKHCRKFRTDPDTKRARYAVVQAEDELASIGMVIGAAWNGARAFTCTAGPGISLMWNSSGSPISPRSRR